MLPAMSKRISRTYFFVGLLLTISFAVKAQSGPPYPVKWFNVIGANSNGTTLSKTHPHWTWTSAGAVSSNVLESNQNGWLEFTASNGYYIIGFASQNTIDVDLFTHAVMINRATNTYTFYEGASAVVSGTCQVTDVFRISREGALMKYYINNTVIDSVNVTAAFLRIKASISQPGTSTPLVYASFDAQLIVQGSSTVTEGTQAGNISVGVVGGTAPYTYSWSSNEQTNSITNKPRGTYSLTVSDAAGRTDTSAYTIGYKVNWINAIGVTVSGSRLTKTHPHYTWITSGAFSSNTLNANADGWIEFSGESVGSLIVGLAVTNTINLTEFTNALHISYLTNSYTVYEGSAKPASGYWQPGDIFRISRKGSVITYYKNAKVIRSVTINPALVLRIKTSIQQPGATTPIVHSSFEGKLVLQGAVLGLEGNSGSGNLTFSASGGTTPYTYSWSTGESTSSLVNKPRGTYTVSVTDGIGRLGTRTYRVGYRVSWASVAYVTVSGSILTKAQSFYTWNLAGGVSSNVLSANTDGWIEFSAGTNAGCIVGLAANNKIDLTQFNNAIVIDYANNSFLIYEGTLAAASGKLVLGDVFRISREGNVVKYYQNEVVIRSVTVNPALTLKIKTSIQVPGTSTPYINSSFWSSDGVVRTYYSIADGNWTTPSTWSLTENGQPSTVYPDDIDKVVIKGHEVTVNSAIKSAGITITSTNNNTRLKVDGNMGALTVNGNIVMTREQGSNSAEVLLVQNDGKLDVKNQ